MTTITICVGSSCFLKGSNKILSTLNEKIKEKNLENKCIVKGACCLGMCGKGIAVKVNNNPVIAIDESDLNSFIENILNGLE